MQRGMSMPFVLQATGASYAIKWHTSSAGRVSLRAAFGSHPFLIQTRVFIEEAEGGSPMEDICGARGANFYEVVSVAVANPRRFVRKQMAAVTGVETVLFMSQGEGGFLELGFERVIHSKEAVDLLMAIGMPQDPRMAAPSWRPFLERSGRSGGRPPRSQSSPPLCRKPSSSSLSSGERSSACEAGLGTVPAPEPEDGALSLEPMHVPMPVPDPEDGGLSLGSMYHPWGCKSPCKYVRKPRGCKDGPACIRCHLCPLAQTNAAVVQEPPPPEQEPPPPESVEVEPVCTGNPPAGVSRHARRRRERKAASLATDVEATA